VLSKRKPKNSTKNLSTALQAINNLLENQLGYTNSNKPSKPNLSNALKPSKFLAPTRLCQTVYSLAYRILQLAHYVNQNELVLSWIASQTPKIFSLLWIWWGTDLAYDLLMGMTMEMMRIEEFGESSVYIRLWMNQSYFSIGFLSQNSL